MPSDELESWQRQLLVFCPSPEGLKAAANGTDGVMNETRRRAAAALCSDIKEWGWAEPLDVRTENARSSFQWEKTEWMPEDVLPFARILDIFERPDFNPEMAGHLFEIEGNIPQPDLRRAVELPFEIGIARVKKRIFAWSGKEHWAYDKSMNPVLRSIDTMSDVFLHTHPQKSGSGNSPSWSDLRAIESNGASLIAHKEGVLRFEGRMYEKAYEWMHEHGIFHDGDCVVPHEEFVSALRRCCIETGIISDEGSWSDEACDRLLSLMNGDE